MNENLQFIHPRLVNKRESIILHDNAAPICFTNNAPEVEETWLRGFFPIQLILQTLLLPASYERECKILTDAEKCIQRVHLLQNSRFLCYRKNKLVTRWQKCVDLYGLYLRNKISALLKYTVINFMIQNVAFYSAWYLIDLLKLLDMNVYSALHVLQFLIPSPCCLPSLRMWY